ncbi:hypothetical protein PULV_a0705 [Pseudoalteromonas ulvae UL12]|uniref:Polyketide cyclase n=1 Tax=Pseudoalteromonas ulvae TaxID=107327 RepID=A0A244CND7_PSEDV|nr:SRPBCC family protein [Pseudoalteromonas ulvae]MBE0363079.1 hypothetical protein [Pseudoalteromonas ulvae UL12]OUL57114.1 hypothetical protein B1199_13125 [Pseudoalteromonas ulvae]
MLKKILRFGTILLILVLVIGFFLPTHYAIKQDININANPSSIHYWTDDLVRWPNWQAWHILTPQLEFIYGEKTEGVGAFLAWQNEQVEGELTISHINGQQIDYNMLFNNEHLALSQLSFTVIAPTQTKVTWSIKGEINTPVLAGYLTLYYKVVLAQALELGLRNLKEQSEITQSELVHSTNIYP